jgi:hypothetical protein
MIQKMIVNVMHEPLDAAIPNYEDYASPYLKDIFANLEATHSVTGVTHSDSELRWFTYGVLWHFYIRPIDI